MNLRISTLALALCATVSASAQQSVGVQAGVGIGRVNAQTFRNEGAPVVRLNLGLTYQRFISQHLTIGADLLYQQRGWRDRVMLVDANGQPTGTAIVPFHYAYAALPIKIGYRSVAAKPRFGYVRVGVVPGLLLSATAKRPDAEGSTQVKLSKDFDKTVDVAGLVEAGGGWRLNDRLLLEAGGAFQYGLSSFSNLDAAHHLGLSANVGLRYELAAKKPAAAQ